MLNLHKKTRIRENHLDIFSKLGIFSLSLLAVTAAVYLYSPVIGTHAAETAGTNVSLNVGDIIGIRANVDELDLTASVGTFVTGTVNVDVTSNSQYGYTLSLEDVDNNTDLVSTEVSNVVSSGFSGSKTSSTMADNNWGYSLDNIDFYAIPVYGSPATIKHTTNVMGTTYETTPVHFGVKVGMNLPATTYADVVKFTAYVNGIDETPTMQDFDKSTLANVGDSIVLKDARDGKKYTVKKLADGNVWMTENLRIIDKTITSEDSNIPDGETFTIPASDLDSFSTTYNVTAAYLDSTYGGYYNFYTVSAGWGGSSVTSGNSPKDICPKGWRLPIGGKTSETNEIYVLWEYYKPGGLAQGDPGFTFGAFIGNKVMSSGRGSWGNYWTSTVYDPWEVSTPTIFNYMYSIDNRLDESNKFMGLTVHCVAQ